MRIGDVVLVQSEKPAFLQYRFIPALIVVVGTVRVGELLIGFRGRIVDSVAEEYIGRGTIFTFYEPSTGYNIVEEADEDEP
jgi:hypothetical protein